MKNQQGLAGQTTIIDVSDKKKINQQPQHIKGSHCYQTTTAPIVHSIILLVRCPQFLKV